jgi:hypothetical protein
MDAATETLREEDEVAGLVDGANRTEPEDEEGRDKPKRRSRKRATTSRRDVPPPSGPPLRGESDDAGDGMGELPEFDPSDRADPEENIKTLEGLCSKYRLGVDPDFYIQILRSMPKYYPGTTVKADGFLEDVRDAITKQYIASRHGGGKYVCVVYGPAQTGGNRFYSRCVVDVPGEMLTGAVQKEGQMGVVQGGVQVLGSSVGDSSPSVVNKALDMFGSAQERSASRIEHLEAKILDRAGGDQSVLDLVRDVTSQQTALLERGHERELQIAQQRLEDERSQRNDLLRRLDTLEHSRGRNESQDFERISALVGKTSDSQERILQHTLERHNEALEAMRRGHEDQIRSMRESHEAEKRTMRENHERDIAANENRWVAKVERENQLLLQEREERRRDREQHEQRVRDREDALRHQHQAAEDLIKAQWESRVLTVETSHQVRIDAMEERIAQLKADLADAKAQVANQGDAFQQIEKARALVDMGRELVNSGGSGSGSEKEGIVEQIVGGIAQDPGGVIAAISAALNGVGGGGAPQMPPGYVPVQLAPAPGAHPQSVMAGLPRGPRAPTALPSRQGPLDLDDLLDQEEREEERRSRALVEAEDLRRRAQPHTPAPPAAQNHAPPPRQQPPARQAVAPGAPQPHPLPSSQLPPLAPQWAILVASSIDKALDDGEEPEEFAERILERVPQQGVVALLERGPEVVLQSVRQHAPNSQALSPAGVRFTMDAFRALLALLELIQRHPR